MGFYGRVDYAVSNAWGWLNESGPGVQAITTVALALLTAAYVVLTWRHVRIISASNTAAANATRRALRWQALRLESVLSQLPPDPERIGERPPSWSEEEEATLTTMASAVDDAAIGRAVAARMVLAELRRTADTIASWRRRTDPRPPILSKDQWVERITHARELLNEVVDEYQ